MMKLRQMELRFPVGRGGTRKGAGRKREGFRIVEFSVQGNHLHMLCEADSKEALSRAMNGILCGMARQLNKH